MNDIEAIKKCYTTREVMNAVLHFVHGDVLDYGCGTRKYRDLLLTKGTSYKGMDIDPASGAEIIGDALNPPIADESFDTIVSNQVLEHVRQPWVMIKHIHRLLKPNGTCIVSAPFMIPFHADPSDYFRFTTEGMKTMCEDVGLNVVLCVGYGGIFASMGETAKQRFMSHYKVQPRWKLRIKPWIERFFHFLNPLQKPGIVYANVICVAHKPL